MNRPRPSAAILALVFLVPVLLTGPCGEAADRGDPSRVRQEPASGLDPRQWCAVDVHSRLRGRRVRD